MLVREVITDAKTGEVTERWVEMPDVLTEAEAAAKHATESQAEAVITGNDLTLRQQAEAALVDLRTYRDRATTTTAQDKAAIKLLVRVAIGLIRLILRKLDATG